ncbi:ABC transporter [Brucella pseudogrignonensis]|uniref:amino acid ABC transporter substrate-binding protein n=1 Tax=Brucella pseudogrignonensis TaxID=419475 RepID=UPI0007DA8C23|nr:amino acid ABC transporter substrate-binding protein [Brucella pseudogrignonensis]ANG98692.1 ABC transporter [Brucella pseudogrignonensis]
MKDVVIAVVSGLALAVPAMAQELDGTLAKVKDTNTITIGYQEASMPFSYLDGNQKPVGYSIDLCLKIADAAKVAAGVPDAQTAFVPVTSANRIPLLLNGTIDLQCGSATNNEERQKQVAFVNSHFLATNRILSKKSAPVMTVADMQGKPVVSAAGTVGLNILNQLNNSEDLGMRVMSGKDTAEAFLILESDRAVAYVMDDVLLAVFAARSKNPDDYIMSTETLSKPEPYGLIIRKDDPAFKELADKVTAEIYQSPEIETIYAKWFQSPIPPNDLNLNYAMSAELKNAFAHPSSSFKPDDYAVNN